MKLSPEIKKAMHRLIAAGFTSTQVGRTLGIYRTTVDYYRYYEDQVKYKRAWYHKDVESNPDRRAILAARKQKYRTEHPEESRAYKRAWRAKKKREHPERVKAERKGQWERQRKRIQAQRIAQVQRALGITPKKTLAASRLLKYTEGVAKPVKRPSDTEGNTP